MRQHNHKTEIKTSESSVCSSRNGLVYTTQNAAGMLSLETECKT